MTSFVNRDAERPLQSRRDVPGERALFGHSRIAGQDPAAAPAGHDPEAADLLRRYLSEIHSYRELGNHALRELERRLTALSDSEHEQGAAPMQPRARINTPLRAHPPRSERPAEPASGPTLAQRLEELSAYLHEDLTRQTAPIEAPRQEPAAETDPAAAPGEDAAYRHAAKSSPSAPVLDRSWFETRFAEMRASIGEIAEKIPTQRLDALEAQFHQLMEKLDARESDRSMAAVEAGLKKLAAYLEDNKRWAKGQDERTRGVEERLDRLSGLVAQSSAALSATAKGLEIIARRTGPELAERTAEIVVRRAGTDLAEQTAEIVAQKLAPRLAELDQAEPIGDLSGEVAKLSAQSKHYARTTDERLKQLQSCLDESLDRIDAVREDEDTPRATSSSPRSNDAHPLDEDYDGKMIAAARRAARLADGPVRDMGEDGDPLRYQIPYGEFLPEEERGSSRIGLIVAAVILLLASVAMLYLNLRERDGLGGALSSLWPFASQTATAPKTSTDRLTTGSVKTHIIAPKPARETKRPAAPEALMTAVTPPVRDRELELTRSDNAAELLIGQNGGRADGLREAAVAGNADAQFSIGEIYLRGEGMDRVLPAEERLSRAARWFRRAADRGHAASQFRLGTLYERGQGVTKDSAEAMRWYSLAAEAGHVKAMHNLGFLSLAQARGAADHHTAVLWFNRAAERGDRDSQFNLGILYERGVAVEKDLAAAHRWYSLSAQQGDSEAVGKRDRLAGLLPASAEGREERQPTSWTTSETDTAPGKASETPKPVATRPSPPAERSREKVAAAPATWSAQISTMDSIVAEAQRLLRKLGYSTGPVDGIMGPRTIAAVRAFERRVGLPSSGQVTDALVAKIRTVSL